MRSGKTITQPSPGAALEEEKRSGGSLAGRQLVITRCCAGVCSQSRAGVPAGGEADGRKRSLPQTHDFTVKHLSALYSSTGGGIWTKDSKRSCKCWRQCGSLDPGPGPTPAPYLHLIHPSTLSPPSLHPHPQLSKNFQFSNLL